VHSTPIPAPGIAVINGGSSSIKFGIFRPGRVLERTLEGTVALQGLNGATLTFTDHATTPPQHASLAIPAATAPARFLVEWMSSRPSIGGLQAVGHRVVHGLQHREPTLVTPALLQDLRRVQPFDPVHLPMEIELIEACSHCLPGLPQVACFDTAFHRDMPRVARQLPLPRRLEQQGVQRYGFHGLSYTWLMEELVRMGDPAALKGRVILAHLGSGASMAAVLNGRCIDTSMGFTPASGLPMGTRSGDLDPGLFGFLARTEQMTAARFDHMVNEESGLLGVSQTSSDVRRLLDLEAGDPRAAEALGLFCYQATKLIGAYAAALGGLDLLVFSGGIGENAPRIRERICASLGFLGISIDPGRNAINAGTISRDDPPVRLRVIHTDEEVIIARACATQLAALKKGNES
jgi:acetate kinase